MKQRVCGVRAGFPEKVILTKERWLARGEERMMWEPDQSRGWKSFNSGWNVSKSDVASIISLYNAHQGFFKNTFIEHLFCVQWDLAVSKTRVLVLFAQGAYHLMRENVNRRKKLYSEIIYHVVFQELTKQTQFSREKCLKLLKSSISSSCCAREGQLEKRLSVFAWPREASAQCIILGRAGVWGRVEEPAGGVWLAVLRVVCLHFLCSSR